MDGNQTRFCRDDFWNETSIWNTTTPRFSQCFQSTVLSGIPCLYLILFSPFWLFHVLRSSRTMQFPQPKKRTYTLLGKLLALMVLLGGNVFKIIWRFSSDDDIFVSDWIGPLLLTLAYVISLFLLVLERRQNVHSSVLHFYFWLLHFLVNIPQFVKDV